MKAAYITYFLLLCCFCATGNYNGFRSCSHTRILNIQTCGSVIFFNLDTSIVTINSVGLRADIAPVCSGDELELTCTLASGRVLEWNVTLMPPEDVTFEYVIDSITQTIPEYTVIINGSVMFTFSRVSPSNSRPLISRLLISPATNVVNGTEIMCVDRETLNSSSTTVNVVHNNSNDRDVTVHSRFPTSSIIIL